MDQLFQKYSVKYRVRQAFKNATLARHKCPNVNFMNPFFSAQHCSKALSSNEQTLPKYYSSFRSEKLQAV